MPLAERLRGSYRIVRRRIVWLLGRWVGEDLSTTTRMKIYQLLVHLLRPSESNDVAVRLTAAQSLAKCDTWDFDENAFVPFLPEITEQLAQLLGEVSMTESHLKVIQALGLIIGRVGASVSHRQPGRLHRMPLTLARLDPTVHLYNNPGSAHAVGASRRRGLAQERDSRRHDQTGCSM
jgi:hypothetical protein